MGQQEAATGDNAYEADNNENDNSASPMSKPTIYNATLVGSNAASSATGKTQQGMVLRRGTGAQLFNHLIVGFAHAAIDVRDEVTVANSTNGNLTVANSLYFSNGDSDIDFPVSDSGPAPLVEDAFFKDSARLNRFGMDPQLGDAFNLTAPNWVPAGASPAMTGGATPPNDGFFDVTATYVGAFGSTNWAAGWTAFPAN